MAKLVGAIVSLLCFIGTADAAQPGAGTAVSATSAEQEFWKSADRVRTPEAYRAYLEAFPNGLYAPLAKIGIQSAAGSRAATGSDSTASLVELKSFREPASSGAVDFSVGDRFIGPGQLTVGWAGSKKQIVLPSGEWRVLAASDFASQQPGVYALSPTGGRVSMTSLIFGKFVGQRLSTLMRFTIRACRTADEPRRRKEQSTDAAG